MDYLRENKKPVLLHDEAFTVMINSEDKLTVAEGGVNSPIVWDYNFGGFTDSIYENYKVEVLNAGHNGFVRAPQIFLYMVCDGLGDTGYFFKKKLTQTQNILAVLPTTALGADYIQATGSAGVTFLVKNARTRKRISIRFLRPDLAETVHETDINVAGVTRWFLILKLTPITDV